MSVFVAPANRHLDRLISEKSIKVIDELHKRPKMRQNFEIALIRWPKLGSLSYLKPMIDENQYSVIEEPQPGDNVISFKQPYGSKQQLASPPEHKSNQDSPPSYMAAEMHDSGADCHGDASIVKLNEFQLELFSLLNSYKDLLYTNETYENSEDVQRAYVAHMLGHLFRSKSRILSNNRLFEKRASNEKILQDDPILRDQGFTRARILVLLPFRFSALRLGKCIASTLKGSHETVNFKRFIEEFGDEDGADSTLRPVAYDGNKPVDYYQTFNGNVDDSFRIGLKLTKKSVKFFADFYDSDIIIASPLGLKTLISPNEQGTDDGSSQNREQMSHNGDRDFLSSIEIVLLDQAEIFLMQNWEHVIDVMQHVNAMPAKPRNMDISRVRMWHLENWSRYYRQLIMFSSITVPLIHSFFQTFSLNYEGYLAFKHRVEHPQARQITNKCTQHFLYYDSPNAKESCDSRFRFFIKQVLPKFTKLNGNPSQDAGVDDTENRSQNHTLIFVSSYFDYVRLRNHFRREKLSFTQICEYTEDNKVSKARQLFYFGARQFLIYTERCHFYHRYKIKGIKNIIFYEPPTFAKFYQEMIEMLTPELQGKKFDISLAARFSATTLFSNHDTLQLGAIMGFNNAIKLMRNKKSIT